MDVVLAQDVKLDIKALLGVGGILLAIVAFVLSRRAEKLVGIPVMTGYGSDHEKAMMEGTLKVRVTTSTPNKHLFTKNSCLCSIRQVPSLWRPNDHM